MKVLFFVLFFISCQKCKINYAKIVSVGGCDRYGDCGVMLDNGISTKEHYPVIGERIKYCKLVEIK